jgi:prepilin-type N-terminal cleavage/methylation domain-containing protein
VKRPSHAFTLIELLAVIAILAVVSAILFPVLASARGSAERAACATHLKQITLGTQLYVADYDDRLMPPNHRPAGDANSRNDRTWVQSLLPYVRNFALFRCPSDSSARPRPEATYDQDLVPGDTFSQYYTASLRSNYGYNFHNLSPIVQVGSGWEARPRLLGDIAQPSETILFVDSVWEEDVEGKPHGGGNWLVVPPCRYYRRGLDSFTAQANATVYAPIEGWRAQAASSYSFEVIPRYGNAYPWHRDRMNVARVDGGVSSFSPRQLGNGCDVKEAWKGRIDDPALYMWDVR